MLTTLRAALVLLAVLVAAPPSVRAASLDVGARVCAGDLNNCTVVGPGQGGGGAVFTGATGIGAETGQSYQTLTLSAGATQDYGVFRARGEIVMGVPYTSAGSFWSASGSGVSRDTWTITGGSGSGTFRAFFTVSGSIAGVPSAGTLDASLTIAMDVANGAFSGGTGPITGSGVYGLSQDLPFTFGAPLPVVTTSFFGATVTAPDDGSALTAAILADFSHTAYLSAIEVFDDQGQPVPGFAITSESGTLYPVPEPGAPASGGIALGGLAGASRWRRRIRR